MTKSIKITLLIVIVVGGLVSLAYYSFLQIDFIGHKSPEVMEATRERHRKMLLSAENRNGTDYIEITLLDSVNIQINAGNAATSTILTKKYSIVGDTITLTEGTKYIDKFLNSDKMVIKKDEILYLIDQNGNFDLHQTMKIQFNKLK